jgi:hypothetical protein
MRREQGVVGAKRKVRWNAQHMLGRCEAEGLGPPQICRYLEIYDRSTLIHRVRLLCLAGGVLGTRQARIGCSRVYSGSLDGEVHDSLGVSIAKHSPGRRKPSRTLYRWHVEQPNNISRLFRETT